ncbi:Rhythmically-expressed protein 2 protein putative isoform 1 [Tripterygium wilfordii]|uniref:Rhythmically-expressed protein 2 protein putative isoform 1 n=1 Tax=Tripterygium wilfordii TaxID=458696 RepID=A0A7J7D915_TRIWF|nr:Rhythmically-expressed protein 2 protein putative isoform 1 [Tripterygium wilfordii]
MNVHINGYDKVHMMTTTSAGYDYGEETFEKSSAPYSVFPDSRPFLRWLREKGLTVGLISNAEYRYKDVILPALGLNQKTRDPSGTLECSPALKVSRNQTQKFIKLLLRFERAGNIAPEEPLHICDSMRKDYVLAKSVGMHALLLDRFKTPDAKEWIKSGAIVLPDLVAVQEMLSPDKLTTDL